ncbi:transposase [Hymenobacter actinosclerus]|uniref:REP element-mobilizing transposase RayT n=1 Tax=Hymenobacter actinosclerus TaxID=82805 RepID=A0A1I0BCA5_9BACT|nr:transposase [Hymenobacter actinosclerus]SET03749.1 REP element-mobilizing transposase RayT [Hymenobacter actinosclerus]
MHLEPGHCYHIYNRGNNRELIFYSKENYIYFLYKIRKHLLPQMRILAWCLMPNHFHLLVQVREEVTAAKCGSAFRVLLSSYTRAIQKQENRTGSLFQQQTLAKDMRDGTADYSLVCFCYIHQNPVRAQLTATPEKWPWSSYADYLGVRQGTLCDQEMARMLLNLPAEAAELAQLTDDIVPADKIERLL